MGMTSTIPSSPCCLRYAGVLLPSKLNFSFAGVIRIALASDIDHAVRSMLRAICRRLAVLEVKARHIGAGGNRAELASDINHAVFSMSLAIHRRHAALNIIGRYLGAGLV